jgi:hypothetical protein
MAKRRAPGQKEYNPLDDARGRLPIDDELIRAVVSDPAPANPTPVPPRQRNDDSPVSPDVAPPSAPHVPPPLPLAMAVPQHLTDLHVSVEEPRLFEEALRDEHRRDPSVRRDERMQGKGLRLEKLTAYNKFLTTQTEKFELERLTARVSGALGASVKPSQLIRACLVLLLRAENEVIRRAERQPQVKRPSNTEAVALAEFDQILAEILSQAFRDAGPIRPRR